MQIKFTTVFLTWLVAVCFFIVVDFLQFVQQFNYLDISDTFLHMIYDTIKFINFTVKGIWSEKIVHRFAIFYYHKQ